MKVNKRGAVPSAHQHAGRGSSQVSGVENGVAVNDPKAAGVGEGATRSLAGWLLVYSEAVWELSPVVVIKGRHQGQKDNFIFKPGSFVLKYEKVCGL